MEFNPDTEEKDKVGLKDYLSATLSQNTMKEDDDIGEQIIASSSVLSTSVIEISSCVEFKVQAQAPIDDDDNDSDELTLHIDDDAGLTAGNIEDEEMIDEVGEVEVTKEDVPGLLNASDDTSPGPANEDMDAVDGSGTEPEKFVIEPKELECLFFGSFYNEKQLKEPALDLVTFATPCKISEIRVIPLGAQVEMLDGVALLGSTNPTNFDVELYYEDLTDPAHATFKEISKFSYDHKLAISSTCGSEDSPIITSKVVVRGVYNSITLAVIGHQVENFPVRSLPPDSEGVEDDLYHEGSSVGSEGEDYEDWDEEDEEYWDDYDEEEQFSEYGDDLEEFLPLTESLAEGERDDSHYDSEEANDDVEMKDAFDPALEDETAFQDQSLLPSPRDELTPSPQPSWDEEKEQDEDQPTPPPEEYLQSGSPTDVFQCASHVIEPRRSLSPNSKRPWPADVSPGPRVSPSYILQNDSDIEDVAELHISPADAEAVHRTSGDEKQLESGFDDEGECDVKPDVNSLCIKEVKSESDIVACQISDDKSPISLSGASNFETYHAKLETEDISDGDISSFEDDNAPAQSEEEMEQETESSFPLGSIPPKSPISAAAEDEDDLRRSQEISAKGVEILSEQEFEDDFEDDLEVISDDEIGDVYESEGGDDLTSQDDEMIPELYDRSFDINSYKMYRPQNFRVEMYPKALLKTDSLLGEKLTAGLKLYVPMTFEVDMLENWVEMMEEVLPILIAYLRSVPASRKEATFATLTFWVKRSFQLEVTTSPESVTRSLRQLKVALKLVFFLCEFEPSMSVIIGQLTLDPGQTVQERVTQTLLESRIPAIQCLCVKVLEATLNTKIGFECFVAKKECAFSSFEQMLTNIMEMKLNTLVYASIGPVFQTVSLIPVLLELSDREKGEEFDVESVLINLRATLDVIEEIDRNVHNAKSMSSVVTVENVVSTYLPSYDARISFVKLLKETNFLNSCYKLMKGIDAQENYMLVSLLVTIFESLLKWEVGVVFLAQEISMELVQALHKADVPRGSAFATYFCHSMTVLKCVDICGKDFYNLTVDEMDGVMDALLDTFVLLSSNAGRKALTHVFTTGDFMVGLLNCVKFSEISSNSKDKIQDLDKTAVGGYAVDILVHIIRTADNLVFFAKHGKEICHLFESLGEDFEGYSKLSEVIGFVKPTLDVSNFTVEGVAEICERIKKDTDEALLKYPENWGIYPEIVTHLRILDSLAISSTGMNSLYFDAAGKLGCTRNRAVNSIGHKLVLVYMNSADILTTFAGILKKIIAEYQQPAVHSHTFLFSKGEAIAALLLPTVRLIRKLLTELIVIRNTNFRDLTLVPLLLETFALVDAFPESATANEIVTGIKVHVIGSLQTHTIPVMKVGDEAEEELINSMWTRMMSEIISFTMNSPSNFISGMTILSELQPLKLPLVSNSELTEVEKLYFVSLRKLWTTFLHGVTIPLQEMLGILCESTNRELVILVKRVCEQVADLSGPSCLVVCRGLMEPILNSIETDMEEKLTISSSIPSSQGTAAAKGGSVSAWVEGSVHRGNIQCSSRTARLLGFLNGLMRNSGIIKAGVLQVLRGTFKVDEKFSEFLALLGSILTSNPALETQKPSLIHEKCQGHVMSIFCTLCNVKVNMFGVRKGDIDEEYLKANSLPPKDAMTLICGSLISFLSCQENVKGKVAVIRKIFFALNILCDTEYGFYHLRISLSKNPTVISDLLKKLKKRDLENLDIVRIMESLEVVDGILSFLRKLITPQPINNEWRGEIRKTIITKSEIRKLLGWSSAEAMKSHVLVQLCTYFHLCITREQNQGAGGNEEHQYLKTYMGEAKEKLDKVLAYVNERGGEGQASISEIVLATPELLQEQFARRPIWVPPCQLNNASQKLQYLSQVGHGSDADFEFSMDDLVFRDLLSTVNEISKETETEFLKELENFCNLKREASTDGKVVETKEDFPRAEFTIGGNSASQRSMSSNLSLSPGGKNIMRGSGGLGRLGYGRGLLNIRPNFDPFRSRPPNTSRPPSLHVDDFVAMESSSQGSSGSNRGRSGGGNDGFRGVGRGSRGVPSPLTRSFNASERGSRGYRSSATSNAPYYVPRNEPGAPRGRHQQPSGRGYSEGGDRWQVQPGGVNESSQSSNYGRQERESNYGERRHYASGGAGSGRGYRDQRGGGRSPAGSSGPNSVQHQQQQRWRHNPKFTR